MINHNHIWYVYGVNKDEILLACECGDVAYVKDFTNDEYVKASKVTIKHHHKNGMFLEINKYKWIGKGKILFRESIILVGEYSKKHISILKTGKVSQSLIDPDIIGVIVNKFNEPLTFNSNNLIHEWIENNKHKYSFPKSLWTSNINYDISDLEKFIE